MERSYSLFPMLCAEGELVKFGACFSPGWVVLLKNGNEAVAVGWLNQVCHLVHDDVFEQVLRLFYELGVEPDITCLVIAASPLGLHPLQEVAGNVHFQLLFPLLDEWRNGFVEKALMPVVEYLLSLVL